MFTEDEQTQQELTNYPIETDSEFTPDEIESIKEYKANLKESIAKKRVILRGLESAFWSVTSYSLARFIVITSGTSGVGLAAITVFFINQIVNRDCLDSINIDYNDGVKTSGMGKLIKFGFSTIVSAFVIWQTTGDLLNMASSSKDAYRDLQNAVEQFNRLPEDNQNTILIIGGLLGLGGVYVIVDSLKK